MIAIIDYDAGNTASVEKAIAALGYKGKLTRNPDEILNADKVILPGVGSFGDAMEKLHGYGLVDVIHKVTEKGTPFLGICLGLQLLFDSSEESPGVEGLHILEGKIVKIPDNLSLKVPHIGWNNLEFPRESKLFRGFEKSPYVYFVHSYYLQAKDDGIVSATTQYGVTIHAAVEKNNVYACQFHPEKSSSSGLHILKNFLEPEV